MPTVIPQTYYLDAPTLGSATCVFTDSTLTICAADGFYSDGVITRELVGCILLPQQICPTCGVPCGLETISASGGQGVYQLNIDTGTGIGAILIRFDPFGVPDGIKAILNSVVYNKLSSPVDGYHQSTNPFNFTFVGDSADDCGLAGSTYPTLVNYLYDGSTFVNQGTTQTVSVLAGDVSLSSGSPGQCLMVIPKTVTTPFILNVIVCGACSGTTFDIDISCPDPLPGIQSSLKAVSSEEACEFALITTYYFASLTNSTLVDIYDYVFTDTNGQFALADGFYHIDNDGNSEWMEIDNGIVIAMGVCELPPLPVTGLVWATTVNNPCNAAPWVISNQNLKIRYNVSDSQNCGGSCINTQSGTATATITVGALDVNMGLSFNGIGELEAPDFEKITFSLDGIQVADAHAAGGNLDCAMGPVVQTFATPPPYLLLAGTVHTFFIDFTTNDGLYHLGSFYEIDLTFTEIP
jgi:hypothetical protein